MKYLFQFSANVCPGRFVWQDSDPETVLKRPSIQEQLVTLKQDILDSRKVNLADERELKKYREQLATLRAEVETLEPENQKEFKTMLSAVEAREQELWGGTDKGAFRLKLNKTQKIVDKLDLSYMDLEDPSVLRLTLDAVEDDVYTIFDQAGRFEEFGAETEALEQAFRLKRAQLEQAEKAIYEARGTLEKSVEEQRNAQEKADTEMEEFVQKLESLPKTPSALTVSPLTEIKPQNPKSYQAIQQGMLAHRMESVKVSEEARFLQECSAEFAEKVAEFEESKSALSLKNIGTFVTSSVGLVVGAPLDIALKVGGWFGLNPQKKRAGDVVRSVFKMKDGPAVKLQEEQQTFTKDMTEKQAQLADKKNTLSEYGNELTQNASTLQKEAPEKIKNTLRENAMKTFPADIPKEEEPWKSIIEKMITNLESQSIAMALPSLQELDTQVQQEIPEINSLTEASLEESLAAAEYVKALEIKSATTLDMSVGFLTKNLAKGLDWTGDIFAKVPVLGVVGGVLRAAGGLVEGIGTLITDPDKVYDGILSLFGITRDGWLRYGWNASTLGDAWGGMFSGLMGGEAWVAGGEAWDNDNVFEAFGEWSAALGEGATNVVATFFTGGAAGGVRGVGMAGRMANISTTTARFASRIPGMRYAAKAARLARNNSALTGIGKTGNVVLKPLKIGVKPLKYANKLEKIPGLKTITEKISKTGVALERVLTPSQWSRMNYVDDLARTNGKLTKKIKGLNDDFAKARPFEKKMITERVKELDDMITKNNNIINRVDPDGALGNIINKTDDVPQKTLFGKAKEKIVERRKGKETSRMTAKAEAALKEYSAAEQAVFKADELLRKVTQELQDAPVKTKKLNKAVTKATNKFEKAQKTQKAKFNTMKKALKKVEKNASKTTEETVKSVDDITRGTDEAVTASKATAGTEKTVIAEETAVEGSQNLKTGIPGGTVVPLAYNAKAKAERDAPKEEQLKAKILKNESDKSVD